MPTPPRSPALQRGRAGRPPGHGRSDPQLSPTVPVSQLDHALQTAALLERSHPDDDELAVAGLVHDIGHLLPGGTDEAHADDGAGRCAARWGSEWPGSWACTWRPSGIWSGSRAATTAS